MFELSQSFYFESAHTLRREAERNEADGSRRVHGHTYTAEVCVSGKADRATGMVVDLAVLRAAIAAVREQLDHHFLDEVPGHVEELTAPAVTGAYDRTDGPTADRLFEARVMQGTSVQ